MVEQADGDPSYPGGNGGNGMIDQADGDHTYPGGNVGNGMVQPFPTLR